MMTLPSKEEAELLRKMKLCKDPEEFEKLEQEYDRLLEEERKMDNHLGFK